MQLFEFAPTRSIRARWVLQELDVPFEAVTIDLLAGENRNPEFLRVNPAGKLPALIDDDMVLTESIAIVLYLGEKYPEKGLIPKQPRQRAQLMRWLLFTATELEQPLWRIARHTAVYPAERRLPGEVALAAGEFAAMAGVLDAHMRDREFVAGDAVTVGDFVLAYTMDWAKLARQLDPFPRLEAYMERMYARPRAPMRLAEAFATIRR